MQPDGEASEQHNDEGGEDHRRRQMSGLGPVPDGCDQAGRDENAGSHHRAGQVRIMQARQITVLKQRLSGLAAGKKQQQRAKIDGQIAGGREVRANRGSHGGAIAGFARLRQLRRSRAAVKPASVSEALEIIDLACQRGGRLLFEGVSAQVVPGGALQLVGPNGTGKSTLLRLLAGLLQPAAGAIRYSGRRAFAGHEVALKPRQPLGVELAHWARLDGGLTRLPAAMTAMNITALAEVPCRLLSSGQRRRAAIARVIAAGAPLWLLDEPTAGLDSASAALLAAAMAAHRAAGGLIVAAVHGDIGLDGAAQLRLG